MQQAGKRIAIIGGGIIGCLTALRLKELGADPIVLERGEAGRESSWAGAGILCPIHPWLYPDSFTHLVEFSLALYPDLDRQLKDWTGQSIEWRNNGLLIPLFADDRISHRKPALAWSARFGWKVEELDRDAARAAEPALSEAVCGALLWPEVGQVRNPRLLSAVRRALDLKSVPLREHAEVVGLRESGGRVSGVLLAGGERIPADQVLVAAGSWSGDLARSMGIELPVEPVKGQIVLLRDEPGCVRHIIKHDDAYMVPRVDGRILVGASMERVGFRAGTTEEVIGRLLDAAHRIAPRLKSSVIERQWMGFRPGTPDGLPYLGPVKDRPGLWVATGHYRNGVALAPGTAEIISRWMLGDAPQLDMTDFRVNRPMVEDAAVGLPQAVAQ